MWSRVAIPSPISPRERMAIFGTGESVEGGVGEGRTEIPIPLLNGASAVVEARVGIGMEPILRGV